MILVHNPPSHKSLQAKEGTPQTSRANLLEMRVSEVRLNLMKEGQHRRRHRDLAVRAVNWQLPGPLRTSKPVQRGAASEESRFAALPSLNCRKKANASDDHLPPTSLVMTTKRQRLHGTANSGYVRCLRRLAVALATPSRFAAPPRALPSQCSADERGVDSNLSPSKKWQASGHHLKSPTTSRLRSTQIQITNKNVRRDACSRLTAHSRRSTLEGKTSPPSRTGWAVMAKGVG